MQSSPESPKRKKPEKHGPNTSPQPFGVCLVKHYPNASGLSSKRAKFLRGTQIWVRFATPRAFQMTPSDYRTVRVGSLYGLNEGNKKTAAAPVLAPPPMVCGCGRRVSRILFPAKTYVKTGGDHFSGIPIARNLKQPTRELFIAPGRRYSLFGLAAGGVYLAVDVTIGAVRSYRTISPLPQNPPQSGGLWGGLFSVALSVGLLRLAVSKHRDPLQFGLSSPLDKLGARSPLSAATVCIIRTYDRKSWRINFLSASTCQPKHDRVG